MRSILPVGLGLALIAGIALTGLASPQPVPSEKATAKTAPEEPTEWRNAFRQLRAQLQERAKEHTDLKLAWEKELKDQKDENKELQKKINEANNARESLDGYFKRNNLRVAWRRTECTATTHDDAGRFEVDFGPDVPQDVTVEIRGISLSRAEHNVSKLRAHVGNVQIQGTKVVGEYKCNLTDNDWNDSGGSMSIDVFARLAPVK